jgi:TusA-related sulfurtransferase
VTTEPVTLELDCRGDRCPQPVIRLAQSLEALAVGEIVAVVADDVAAGPDLQAWCRMRGQAYLGAESAPDGTPRHLIRRLA